LGRYDKTVDFDEKLNLWEMIFKTDAVGTYSIRRIWCRHTPEELISRTKFSTVYAFIYHLPYITIRMKDVPSHILMTDKVPSKKWYNYIIRVFYALCCWIPYMNNKIHSAIKMVDKLDADGNIVYIKQIPVLEEDFGEEQLNRVFSTKYEELMRNEFTGLENWEEKFLDGVTSREIVDMQRHSKIRSIELLDTFNAEYDELTGYMWVDKCEEHIEEKCYKEIKEIVDNDTERYKDFTSNVSPAFFFERPVNAKEHIWEMTSILGIGNSTEDEVLKSTLLRDATENKIRNLQFVTLYNTSYKERVDVWNHITKQHLKRVDIRELEQKNKEGTIQNLLWGVTDNFKVYKFPRLEDAIEAKFARDDAVAAYVHKVSKLQSEVQQLQDKASKLEVDLANEKRDGIRRVGETVKKISEQTEKTRGDIPGIIATAIGYKDLGMNDRTVVNQTILDHLNDEHNKKLAPLYEELRKLKEEKMILQNQVATLVQKLEQMMDGRGMIDIDRLTGRTTG
jgi:hypothetical protein